MNEDNNSLLAILGSERFAILIAGLIVQGLIAFIPELEPLEGEVSQVVAVLTGLLIAMYTMRRPGVAAK